MDEAKAIRATRAHLEQQFPKVCRSCGRTFTSLYDYLENTRNVGQPVSYDAERGNWRPFSPAGTLSFANCRCGTTLALGSEGMPLLTLWRLMAWGRAEVQRRNISIGEFLEGLRAKLEAQVRSAPPAEPWSQVSAERMTQWRTSLVELHLTGIVVVVLPILILWMAMRPEPAWSQPAPALLLLYLLSVVARAFAPREAMRHIGVLVVILSGAGALPVLGALPGPALVLLSGAVLAMTTYGLRWGVAVLIAGAAEYLWVGMHGAVAGNGSPLTEPLGLAVTVRMTAFFTLVSALLLVALSRVFTNLEQAWLSQHMAAMREREARDELRRAEAAARGVERLEALGRLAGGVAHDFNNLLLIILSWTDLMSDPSADEALRSEGMASVRQAAMQATGLTRRLLTFARKDAWTPTRVDVDAVVGSMMESLRRLVPSNITVVHTKGATPPVPLDESGLGRILVNLTVNAADAMPAGGEIHLSSYVLPAAAQPLTAPRPDADHVVLRVADTGQGMDEATRERAFEPLFTTKPEGKGTGLGLASVYGIVQQAGGWIELESKPGHGAVFLLGFPATTLTDDVTASTPSGDGHDPVGKVLVVEDDEQLRNVVGMTLRAAGHDVTLAANVADGLLAIRRDAGTFDVLCTDAVMPGEPTRALVDGFAERFPGAGVIVFSGYPAAEMTRLGLDTRYGDFLPKPFVGNELVKLVQAHVSRIHPRRAVA